MKGYETIKLTHANLKRELWLVANTVVGYHASPANNCTHVYCIGQTIFPASETPEQIDNLLKTISQERCSNESARTAGN
jgi:hypothetical protein